MRMPVPPYLDFIGLLHNAVIDVVQGCNCPFETIDMKVAGHPGRVKIRLRTQMPELQSSRCLSTFQRGYALTLTVGEQPPALIPV